MTTLTANKPRFYGTPTDKNSLPVAAATTIYEGCAVGDNGSGYARKLVSGDPFRGFALRKADNSAGAAGDINIEVRRSGIARLSISVPAAVAITDVGQPVFASDDDTFTMDGSGSFVGYVCRYVSSGVAEVEYNVDEPENLVPLSFGVNLASITGTQDVVTTYTPGFKGAWRSLSWVQNIPVTTGAKAATISGKVNAAALTGGAIALTSATATPMGKVIAASAITAGGKFAETDTITLNATAVTAFAEGSGEVIVWVTKGKGK